MLVNADVSSLIKRREKEKIQDSLAGFQREKSCVYFTLQQPTHTNYRLPN